MSGTYLSGQHTEYFSEIRNTEHLLKCVIAENNLPVTVENEGDIRHGIQNGIEVGRKGKLTVLPEYGLLILAKGIGELGIINFCGNNSGGIHGTCSFRG
jgi:hypothetical protein